MEEAQEDRDVFSPNLSKKLIVTCVTSSNSLYSLQRSPSSSCSSQGLIIQLFPVLVISSQKPSTSLPLRSPVSPFPLPPSHSPCMWSSARGSSCGGRRGVTPAVLADKPPACPPASPLLVSQIGLVLSEAFARRQGRLPPRWICRKNPPHRL